MAEEHKEEMVVDKKADAEAGEKLDKVLAHLDSVAKMCDSLGKRMDAYEEEKAKADAASEEEQEEEKADEDDEDENVAAKKKADDDLEEEEGKPVPVAADKAKRRKDAEEEEMADKTKADSADLRRKIAALEARLPKQISDEDYAKMADAQARADAVYNSFGKRAPRPLDGETLNRYRRRLATNLKEHSPTWKGVDLGKINDEAAFTPIESQIYSDAQVAARNPVDLDEDVLREITTRDRMTDRVMNTFVGKKTFISAMKSPTRVVGRFVTRQN